MQRALILFAVFFAGMAPSWALETSPHNWELGSDIFYHNYDEPGVMEQEGVFWGVRAAYEFRRAVMVRGEGSFSIGEVDYSSPISGTMDGIDDALFETRLLLGYDAPVRDNLTLTPFTGFGYRYLNDDSSGMATNTGAVGYERESNYYYSPIGMQAVARLNPQWDVDLSGEYDLFWKGKQKNHLSEAIAGLSDLENDQDDGYGLRGSLKLWRRAENMDVGFEGFIRYWDIDRSDLRPVSYLGQTIGHGYEPANETVEAGGGITVRF